MADFFTPEDLQKLLAGKHVVFLGDSVMRAIYKDFVWLANDISLIPSEQLKMTKMTRFPDLETARCEVPVKKVIVSKFDKSNRDRRVGDYIGHIKGRDFREERQYRNRQGMEATFLFITRAWSERIKEFLTSYKIKRNGHDIDYIFISSAIWDLSRWGPRGAQAYENNLNQLLQHLSLSSPTAKVFYLTSPPCAAEVNSAGMSVAGLESHMLTTRHHVLHANEVAANKFASAGHSVVDLHFHLQLQTSDRAEDGIHWMPSTHRLITNLLLTSLAIASRKKLPGRVESFALDQIKPIADDEEISKKREELLLKPPVNLSQQILAELSSEKAKELKKPLAGQYKAKMRAWRQFKIPAHPSKREEQYFSELKALYKEHENNPTVPPLSSIKEVTWPRIYSDPATGEIIGIDSVEEFLDTNHPLWWAERNRVEALVKEFKNADELNKKLAELVAQDWKEVVSRPQTSNLFLAGGRSYRQPKRFHNLSHCSQVVTTSSCDSENTTKEEIELEERLDNKEITEDECSKQSKESGRKDSLINSKKESEKKVSQSPPVQNVSESEAERLLVSIVGTTDQKRLMEITSSLSEWFDLRRCTTSRSSCTIPRDSVLALASLEESLLAMKELYPSPYIAPGSRVVELRGEEASVEEEERQRGEARLKEQLAKDGDLGKYLRDRKDLLEGKKFKIEQLEEYPNNKDGWKRLRTDEAEVKERLARESELEVNAEPKKRKLRDEKDSEELGMSDQEGFPNKCDYDDESGLTEVEKVQSALARIKEQLSRDKDAKEYKKERKYILRAALERLRRQLSEDGNMSKYIADKASIDQMNC